jgi:general stress protein 26
MVKYSNLGRNNKSIIVTTEQEAIDQALVLVNRSTIAMLGTNDAEGYPDIRALIKMENNGLRRFWFSTNTSSKKIAQLEKNPKGAFTSSISTSGWV